MSLNGLDDVKVKETYDAAVAEPGGWFLLKYVSRDEVQVLAQGNGGIVEIRDAVAAFEEQSPLFGFLRYRRRKVLIKYVPEGCSRLAQARATVHFNAITEKFSPHDTIFPISAAKELKDSTLSSACKLHAASGSTSSSTSSIKKRLLMEIEEEAEDDKRQATAMEDGAVPVAEPSPSIPVPEPPLSNSISVQQSDDITSTSNRSPITGHDSQHSTSPLVSSDHMSRPPTSASDDRRASSQSQRLNLFNLNLYVTNERPKVKLGPRPSLDSGGRPSTASGSIYRPVSTLPAGLKLFSRSSKRTKDHHDSQTIHEAPGAIDSDPAERTAPTPEDAPLRPHTSGGRPTMSSGSLTKGNLSLFPSAAPKIPPMTPERARLMKALQLRKKTQMTIAVTEPVPPVLQRGISTPKTKIESSPLLEDSNNKVSGANSLKEGDSGIVIESPSNVENTDSDATRTISTPASPVEPHEEAASTEASSISESTEETVRETGTNAEGSIAKSDRVSEKEGVSPATTIREVATLKAANDERNSPAQRNLEIKLNGESQDAKRYEGAVPIAPSQDDQTHTETLDNELRVTREKPLGFAPAAKDTLSKVAAVESPAALRPDLNASTKQQTSAQAIESESTGVTHALESPTFSSRSSVHSAGSVSEGSEQSLTLAAQFETAFSPNRDALRDWKIPGSKFSFQDLNELGMTTSNEEQLASPKHAPQPESLSSSRQEQLNSLIVVSPLGPPTGSTRIKLPLPEHPLSAPAPQPLLDRGPNELASTENFRSLESPAVATQLPSQMNQVSSLVKPSSPISTTFSIDTKTSVTADGKGGKARKENYPGLGETIPIETDIMDGRESSEVDFLSDDDLMDELQSATVQEAQPISVSKSPIKPLFPAIVKRYPPFPRALKDSLSKGNSQLMASDATRAEPKRSLSTSPNYLNKTDQELAESRRAVSVSPVYLNRMNQKPMEPLVKKANIGSGISQRIKALEKLSKTGSDSNSTAPAPILTSSFYAVRQSSFSGGSKSPSVSDRANYMSRPSHSPAESRDSSPEAFKRSNRSETISSRREVSGPPPMPLQVQKSQPESISVTARIVRDANVPFPETHRIVNDPLDYARLDLKKSPLVIDHQKELVVSEIPKDKTQERRLSNSTNDASKNDRKSSITIVKDLWNETRNSFAEKRKPISIEAPIPSPLPSPSKPPSVHQNVSSPLMTGSMSASSRRSSHEYAASLVPSLPLDDNSSKPSRASRMLRRMSSQLGRKPIAQAMISPTLVEDPEPSLALLSLALDTEIGDVNVQFPDTLLWKRRTLRVNQQGFLELTLASGSQGIERGSSTKRFHLSDFRTPFVPELESQELPNSVVLEFIGGCTGLQFACEDRGGQVRVLSILTDAHRMWANLER